MQYSASVFPIKSQLTIYLGKKKTLSKVGNFLNGWLQLSTEFALNIWQIFYSKQTKEIRLVKGFKEVKVSKELSYNSSKKKRLVFRAVLGSQQIWAGSTGFSYTLSPPPHRLARYRCPTPVLHCSHDEPLLTRHHHPKSIVSIWSHSWCYTLYGFWQTHFISITGLNLLKLVSLLQPELTGKGRNNAERASWEGKDQWISASLQRVAILTKQGSPRGWSRTSPSAPSLQRALTQNFWTPVSVRHQHRRLGLTLLVAW